MGLENMFRTARSDASNAHSARNQGLAFCVLLTMILVCIAIMQLQTYCDPLALLPQQPVLISGQFTRSLARQDVFSRPRAAHPLAPLGLPAPGALHIPWHHAVYHRHVCAPRRKQNKGAADGLAFKFAFGLTFAYFVFCLIVFAGWLLAFGYHWNSSIVSRPENVLNFMLVSLLPGFGAAYLARRAIAVRFARKPEKFDGVQGMLNFALIESVEAFERMDSYYLTLFYWNLCAILAVCLFGLLASQFSFILPLIFYSKYIDASTWEYRFQIMTLQACTLSSGLVTGLALGSPPNTRVHDRTRANPVQIMATPLQLWTIGALAAWGGTRIDKPSMMQLHELKVLKADRRELPEEEEEEEEEKEGGGADGNDGQKIGGGKRKDTAKENVEKPAVAGSGSVHLGVHGAGLLRTLAI